MEFRKMVNDNPICKTARDTNVKNRLLDSSHPEWRVMVPHCGFDLHFSDNE